MIPVLSRYTAKVLFRQSPPTAVRGLFIYIHSQRHTLHYQKNTIYVFTLDWPGNGEILKIQHLNNKEIQNIQSVSFLASGENVKWAQDINGLSITMPSHPIGEYAYVFKITLSDI